jgi:hypothetical protein
MVANISQILVYYNSSCYALLLLLLLFNYYEDAGRQGHRRDRSGRYISEQRWSRMGELVGIISAHNKVFLMYLIIDLNE